MRRVLIAAVVIVLGMSGTLRSFAATPEFTPKITEVTVFKDGHVLVMSSGRTTLEAGWCRTREVAVPVLGTFWTFVKAPGARVDFVKAGFVDAESKRPCLTFEEIIEANQGKEAIVTELPAGTQAAPVTHEGVLMGLLKHKATEEVPSSTQVSGRRDVWGNWIGPRTVTLGTEQETTALASFVMLRKPKGVDLIRRENIRGITLLDAAPATTHVETKKVREIAIHVDRPGAPAAAQVEVGMVYLQKGLRWIPDYQIEVLAGGKAKLTLQGTLINELADLENAQVHLVVGVPSFLMKDEVSPMALREVGLQLGRYFAPPPGTSPVDTRYQYLSNAMMSQRAAPVQGPAEGAGGVNVPGEGQREDLFLYHLPAVTLAKGERAVVKLFEVTVPCEDIYTLEIPPLPPREMWRNVGENERRQMLGTLTGAKAMHELRLTNTGKDPWTTGPAIIFKDGTPLGQHLMTFTSVSNSVDIPVTVATDLNTKKEETEVDRKPNIRIDGDDYTQVTLKGTLTVTNFKDRDVVVKVTRKVIGTVTGASEGGKIRAINAVEDAAPGEYGYPWFGWSWPAWWNRVNGLAEVTWEMKVPKGKAVSVTYSYYYHYR
ncbi:MAG TPA: hypothetical protein VMY39_06095 [Planctomycetota bacterium]|nr:hypothetical protein [Planctomycetota bacterium]